MKPLIAALLSLLISSFAIAQQQANQQGTTRDQSPADAAWARAGCGSDDIHLDVRVDKTQHPVPQPETGKGTVYVFEQYEGLLMSGPTTRVGMDGKWMGGNTGKSYFYFPVEPGVHRLCVNWQSKSKFGGALDFSAKAANIYYFVADFFGDGASVFRLKQVEEAEAQFLIATHSLSASHQKKTKTAGQDQR